MNGLIVIEIVDIPGQKHHPDDDRKDEFGEDRSDEMWFICHR